MSGFLGGLVRVSENMLCPVCSGSKWCTVSEDGKIVYCPRTENKSGMQHGTFGYVHVLDKPISVVGTPIVEKALRAEIDWKQIMAGFTPLSNTNPRMFAFASNAWIATRFAVKWAGAGYVYPMYLDGVISGIQLRYTDGKKHNLAGTTAGVFLPLDMPYIDLAAGTRPLYVTEGFSDAVAMTHVGFTAVGRMSAVEANGIANFAKILGPARVVIVADNDPSGCGVIGAKLAATRVRSIIHNPVKIVKPRAFKDVRASVEAVGAVLFDVVMEI